MKKVLITGATGNVGIEVLSALKKIDHQLEIYSGVRDTEFGNEKLLKFNIKTIKFDFMNIECIFSSIIGHSFSFIIGQSFSSKIGQSFSF